MTGLRRPCQTPKLMVGADLATSNPAPASVALYRHGQIVRAPFASSVMTRYSGASSGRAVA